MAKGFDRHQQRKQDIDALGRVLGRRSHSRCELCGDRTSLSIIEVPPLPEDPDEDHAVMVCARCKPAVEGEELRGNTDSWRFLAEAVWSETAPVQVVAVRATRGLADQGVEWARETVEGLYLDEAIEARI